MNTGQDLDAILQAASDAKTAFRRQEPRTRYAQLAAIADRLDSEADALVAMAMEESHLPEGRLRGELKRTTVQLRLFAEEVLRGDFVDARIDQPDPDFGTGPRPDLRRMKTPLGVVLNFSASNFPFAFSVAGGDTASALAAGCPVIVKAHQGHTRLSEMTAAIVSDALQDTGAPEGTFALITGREAGVEALKDDRVDAASFTGSVSAGLLLAGIAADRPRPIPFYGELGSINPVFVTESAVASRGKDVIEGFAGSFTLGNGQFCTKPGLLFLPAGHGLDETLVEKCRSIRTGQLLTDSITSSFGERTRSLEADLPGRVLVQTVQIQGCPQPGVMKVDFPTFLENVKNISTEVFGPFAVIVEYTDPAQLLEAARHLEGSLTAVVHAEKEESENLRDLVALLQDKAGRVLFNDWPTGVSVTPAQHHGGPFPATTNPLHTAVGTAAVERFLRPVAFQNVPEDLLPEPLRTANPWGIPQKVSTPGESAAWGRSLAGR
ncbi:aldehyde dehydrogenase (NADP(+)) [Arthrobacter ginkgonis]